MRADLKNRLLIGPILAGSAIGLFFWDYYSGLHLGWFLGVMAAVYFGSVELKRLAERVAGPVQISPMIFAGWAMVICTWLEKGTWAAANLPAVHAALRDLPYGILALSVGMMWTIFMQMRRRAFEKFFTNVALTCFGMVYMGVTACLLLTLVMIDGSTADISYPQRGVHLLALLFGTCKLGDITAYFGGRTFGKHKMSPRISPGKTWEGFASSFIGSVGGAYLITWVFSTFSVHSPFTGWWQPAVWGLIIGPLGVVGDLAESCMKRQADVKDSGDTLPGFGGWLDIFDAIILAAPIGVILAYIL